MSGRRYRKRMAFKPTPPKNGNDPRIVYGAQCTWWGSVADAFMPTRNLHHRELVAGHPLEPGIPVCPNCYKPLMQFPNETGFWLAVQKYEEGTHGVNRPHAGYREFMEWCKRRCFPTALVAASVYVAQTGRSVDITLEDFQIEEDHAADDALDDGENHAQVCESDE